MTRTKLKVTFHLLCVVATIGLQIQCLYNYILNENSTVVEYQKFQQNGFSGYPSLSLCFFNPFLEDRLMSHGTNTSSYIKYLQGSFEGEHMKKMEYDHVTISLEDYLNIKY